MKTFAIERMIDRALERHEISEHEAATVWFALGILSTVTDPLIEKIENQTKIPYRQICRDSLREGMNGKAAGRN